MGWGPGTPAAHPYPKSWQVTPPPPVPSPLTPATVHCIFTNIENPKAGIITTFSEFACFAFSFYFFRRNRMETIFIYVRRCWLCKNGHYGYTIMRHISQKLKLEEGRMFKYFTNSPSPAEKFLIARILERKDWGCYAPSLNDPPGTSSNRIVCPSVCLSVCPSVRNSAPLTNKVQYLKFGWWYSPQTWTVSSSMGSSHFTDITCPGDGAVSKCRTSRFLPYFDTVAAGCIRVSQTRLGFVCIGKWKDTGQV